MEGTGHYYADEYWKKYGEPHGLLSEENAPVPVKSLTMLHAGLGLSVADRLLGTLTTESTPPEVRAALQLFVTQCKNNSRKGYSGAAIESLGLVSRDFYPDLLKIVSEQFRMVRMIRSVQPAGPYRVAGWSLGGTMAYEIATQLIGAHEQVEFIAMFDTFCPRSSAMARRTRIDFNDSAFLLDVIESAGTGGWAKSGT